MSRRSLGSTQAATDATTALSVATTASAAATTAQATATSASNTATAAGVSATAASATANGEVSRAGFDLPTGAVTQTLSRGLISSITLAALTSAQLYLIATPLVVGQVVSSISFLSGSTALNTGANQWFALFSSARVLRAISADDTSTAWGANSVKTLAVTTPYTVTASGLHYLGVMVKATVAVPTLAGVLVPNTTALNLPPILCGNADAALTNPASCPATASAITVAGTVPFGFAS